MLVISANLMCVKLMTTIPQNTEYRMFTVVERSLVVRFHTTSNKMHVISESAHVLSQTLVSLVLLIDDHQSVAGFYILIKVSARY